MANKTPQPIVAPSEPEFELPQPYAAPGVDANPISNFTSTPGPQPINNTTIATSADTAPINSFWQTGAGQAQKANNQNIAAPIGSTNPWMPKMQSTQADKPTDYLTPEARQMTGYGNAALGGVAAGGQVSPTADTGDALLQVAGAGVGGAAAGFAAGGPVGGVIGGIVGLVSGGINAYVGTHAARKKQRKEDKIRQDIQARDEMRYQQARRDQQKYFDVQRGDDLEKERYNRKLTAAQSQWAAQERARAALNDSIAQDANLKHMLVGDLR